MQSEKDRGRPIFRLKSFGEYRIELGFSWRGETSGRLQCVHQEKRTVFFFFAQEEKWGNVRNTYRTNAVCKINLARFV